MYTSLLFNDCNDCCFFVYSCSSFVVSAVALLAVILIVECFG